MPRPRAVAAALGIRLPYPDPLAAVEAIARRTAANRSSMLQDVLRGAPTEIDAISGAMVRAGQRMRECPPRSTPRSPGWCWRCTRKRLQRRWTICFCERCA